MRLFWWLAREDLSVMTDINDHPLAHAVLAVQYQNGVSECSAPAETIRLRDSLGTGSRTASTRWWLRWLVHKIRRALSCGGLTPARRWPPATRWACKGRHLRQASGGSECHGGHLFAAYEAGQGVCSGAGSGWHQCVFFPVFETSSAISHQKMLI